MNLKRRLDWPYSGVFDPERFVRVGLCAGCMTRHLSFAEKLTPDPTGNLIQFELCGLNFVKSVAVESAFCLPDRM
jgi:hypothetical protein